MIRGEDVQQVREIVGEPPRQENPPAQSLWNERARWWEFLKGELPALTGIDARASDNDAK